MDLQVGGTKPSGTPVHHIVQRRANVRAVSAPSAAEPVPPQASASVARLPFLTRPMWLVLLLRSDIRQGAAPEDPEVQQEFAVWWLLWGRQEYPAVWHWNAELSEVVMRLVPVAGDLRCPRLLRRIHQTRDDVRDAFPLRDAEDIAEFLCWYRVHGPTELETAPPLPESCLAITESPSRRSDWSNSGTGIPRIAIRLARRIPNFSLQGSDAPQIVAAWYQQYGRGLLPPPTALPCPVIASPRGRPLAGGGVNLVGFVRGQSGLAEDVRMAAAALEAANIAYVLIDVPTGPAAAQQAASLTDRLKYDLTIYCMSAFDTASLYVSHGPDFFAGQYRIGYWPWELPRFPDLWTEAYTLVDEIWTGSTFTKNAYRFSGKVPVHRLPCPVVLPHLKPVQRGRLGLHEPRAFVFVYPFDVNSYLIRKNPLSLVRAFCRAFPPGDNRVALLLRVNGDPDGHPGWQDIALESAADHRITILTGTLSRERALGIIAACDCLVSPHRGEGFGRNIAEAIMLGLPVLATAFSGCMDFLADNEGIPFVPTTVRPGDYPFGEGQMWAEPSIAEMAKQMRAILQARQSDPSAGEQSLLRRQLEVTTAYSPGKTGRDFARRLQQIERERRNQFDRVPVFAGASE